MDFLGGMVEEDLWMGWREVIGSGEGMVKEIGDQSGRSRVRNMIKHSSLRAKNISTKDDGHTLLVDILPVFLAGRSTDEDLDDAMTYLDCLFQSWLQENKVKVSVLRADLSETS